MHPVPADLRAVESLLAFWRDAGVDACFEDAPVDRTARPARAEPPPRPALVAATPVPAGPDIGAALAEARRLAAAADTLEALEAAIAGFDGLARAGAKRPVFARGNPNAAVMVIGEAPGAEEEAEGAPFAGRSGRLLDRMLAAAGLTDRAFVTTTVFWRPPGAGQPSPQEQAVCRPFLERAVALVSPQVLLAVGGASAKSLLGRDEGILSLRGKWAEWRSEDGAKVLPVLPTLHPDILLRNPLAKKMAWVDLLEVSQRVDPSRN